MIGLERARRLVGGEPPAAARGSATRARAGGRPPRRSRRAARPRTRGSSRACRSARRRRGRGSCRRASRGVSRSSAADLLGRLERAAADEDGEAAEQRLLSCVVEQLEAPADRVAQRPLARPARRARPTSAARAGAPAARASWSGSSNLTRAAASSIASGRQSRRSADLRDRSEVGLVRPEVRAHRACPLEEDAHGGLACRAGRARTPAPRRRAAACGSSRRPSRVGLSATIAASEGAASTTCSKLSTTSRSRRPSSSATRRCSRSPSKSQQAERARDRCDNEAGVADGLERHEDDAVRELVRGRPQRQRARGASSRPLPGR